MIEMLDSDQLLSTSGTSSTSNRQDTTFNEDMPLACEYVCEWSPTNLLLPSHDGGDVYLCLPVNLSEATYFKLCQSKEETKDDGYCGEMAAKLRLASLDRYISTIAPLAKSTQRLMACEGAPQSASTAPNHKLVTSSNSGRVINVLQGEIAHCTRAHADTLVSDDATTCHILCIHSRYHTDSSEAPKEAAVLATLTHIDAVGYKSCIRSAVTEHVDYHTSRDRRPLKGTVKITLHVVGGFNDKKGSSIRITEDILLTLAELSNEFDYRYSQGPTEVSVSMTLETCAVSSANDDGAGCPLARGIGMDTFSGSIFLAEVEEDAVPSTACVNSTISSRDYLNVKLLPSAQKASAPTAEGPEATLRSMRLWASAFHVESAITKQLHVIHRSDSDCLWVTPFFFGGHPAAAGLLQAGDKELIRITSTSPAVEKPNFVRKVRQSLSLMNSSSSMRVFTKVRGARQPMKFKRVGANSWARLQ